jgi:capsular exopolysaccharide synthesis family protein
MNKLVPSQQPAPNGRDDRWIHPHRTPTHAHEPAPVDIGRLLYDLRRRWWIPLVSTILAGLVAWYHLRHQADVYTADTVIQIADFRDPLAGLGKGPEDRTPPDYSILSQVGIIRSRAVATAVVDSEPLGLRVRADGFSNAFLSDVAVDEGASPSRVSLRFTPTGVLVGGARDTVPYGQRISAGGTRLTVVSRPGEITSGEIVVRSRDAAVDDFLFHLDVVPRRQTNIIDISYSAEDASTAVRVVNRVATLYQATNTRMAQQQLHRRRIFIEDQLARTDAQLAEADRALSTFRNQQQAYSSQEKFKSQQSVLVALDVRREELDGDRKMARSLLKKFETGDAAARQTALSMLASAPEIAGDRSPVPDLYKRLIDYQRSREELVSGPAGKAASHPDVQRLDTLIASTQAELISAAQSHIALLDARIESLDEMRSRDAGALGQLPAAEASETRLQQNADALRAQGASLRTEYQQARIAEAAEVGQVEIVDLASRASVAQVNAPRFVLFLLLLGLLAGAVLAVLLERSDRSVKQRDDVEVSLRVPVLGTIPRIDGDELKRTRFPALPDFARRYEARKNTQGSVALTTAAQSRTPAAEAFRQLGTSLVYSRGWESVRRILVTSPTEGDGKTSIAANLAITLAGQRFRVLLVDCDVYGKQHSLFNLPSSPGVSEVVLEGLAPTDVIQPSGVAGLSVMTSGKVPAQTSDIIGSERMRAMLNDMSQEYDLLVLDCSPILALADSTILSVNSDAVLLVVRAGHTAVSAAGEAMRHLSAVGARVAGVVLNDPDHRARQYGGYGYSYGYGYGANGI